MSSNIFVIFLTVNNHVDTSAYLQQSLLEAYWILNHKHCKNKHGIPTESGVINNNKGIIQQYNKSYILSTFEKIEIVALSKRRFNKLSNDTKFINIEVIQVLQTWPARWPFCCTGSHVIKWKKHVNNITKIIWKPKYEQLGNSVKSSTKAKMTKTLISYIFGQISGSNVT